MLSIEDLATHLQMAVPTQTAALVEMQRHLDAALRHVAAECGTAVSAGALTLPVTASASGSPYVTAAGQGAALLLPAVRITSVVSVIDPDGVEVTPLRIDLLAGIVWVPMLRSGTWRITVTFDDLPPDLELAVLIIAAHLYGTQRVPGMNGEPNPRPGLGGQGIRQGLPPGVAIPNRAAALMGPYRLPGIA